MKPSLAALSLLLLVGLFDKGSAADWPQFRGPNASAVSTEAAPGPNLEVAWSVDLPGRGLSSPILIGDKVFLTCASGPDQSNLHVFCFSTADGKKLWERVMKATGRTMSHNKTNVAAATMCSDGERVFALYSSNDLFAFDLAGNLLWLRGLTYDYANASNSLGMSSSPVVVDETLIVQSENDSESLAVGINVVTGKNRWKMERPKSANWTSAVVYQDVVALQSSKGLTGIRPRTGEVIWDYTDGASTIPSSAVTQTAIYVPSNGVTALAPEKGAASQLWRASGLKPGTGSPLVLGESIYVLNNTGVLIQASIANGDEAWKLRLKGPISGSPVAAGKYIYIASERGDFQVVDTTAKEGEVVHTVELKDTILSTPAISDGAVYIRSDKKLWKLK
ncbi:outer membrane protein assembly factor BamB [Prosthecobacter fusiformis]|uniref:Outer membrane protein assembly factor BamB n=1 Tax=Prosthecobacter fusiformis TaxID=48464 RepID=A0A4R7RXP7_9BACT|nr:PQQ-binding-like beta-propeller repeat protein [Prosthecobacter fusiformis]TDU70561.1 outer membrane protein assembly factor BamB [Prosthecobacter fusiformis]